LKIVTVPGEPILNLPSTISPFQSSDPNPTFLRKSAHASSAPRPDRDSPDRVAGRTRHAGDEAVADITLRRFAEFQNLQGAFGRRAIIEQAKGILMERNGIDAEAAFALLKSHSQQNGRKVIDVAQAVTQTHQLLASARTDTK
jgi:hypothetical protein